MSFALLAVLVLAAVLASRSMRRKGEPRRPGIGDSQSFRYRGQHRDSGLPDIEVVDDDGPPKAG